MGSDKGRADGWVRWSGARGELGADRSGPRPALACSAGLTRPGEGVPGGCGIPGGARLLLTLPDDQPGNTVLARKRRTTSHLAGHWPAGTPAGVAGGQAGRGGAGVARTARDRGRGVVGPCAWHRSSATDTGRVGSACASCGAFCVWRQTRAGGITGRSPALSVQGRDTGEAKEVTSASNHALTSASGSPRCGLSARPASRWGS